VRFVIAAFNLKLGDDLSSVVQTIDAASRRSCSCRPASCSW
jgi:hypothetical protein